MKNKILTTSFLFLIVLAPLSVEAVFDGGGGGEVIDGGGGGGYVGPDLVAGGVTPTTATVGTPVTLSASVVNYGDLTTSSSFTSLFQRATSAAGAGATDIGTHTASALAAGGTATAALSYTFPSAATWYVRVCADKNSAASTGTIAEYDETNNCGAWTAVTANAAAAPTAAISASPTSITSGQSTTVTWSSTNATACTGTNFTATGLSGSVSVSPTTNTSYSVRCTGASSAVTATTTVTVTTAPVPTVTVSASPTSVSSGQSSTITWTSANATSCTGTNFSTANQTSGSVSVSPTVTTTYTVTCTGAGGTGSNTVTVTLAAPSYNTTAVPNSICSGGTLTGTASYSSNTCVSYCLSSNASCCTTKRVYFEDSGAETYTCTAYTGTQSTVTNNGGYTCSYAGGEPVNCKSTSWTATLINYGPAVTASLVTNPTSISAGQSAILTWSSANATTCTGTNFSTGNATSGSVTVNPSTTTTYTLSCTGAGGTATDTKTLTVNVFTVTCSASPNPVTVYQPVSWTSAATGGTGAYSYTWSGTDSLSGSASSLSKTYSTLGEKVATLSVTSGGSTITTACTGQPCQQASCTCSGAGCGAVVQEGVSSDITASIPTVAGAAPYPGGSVSFEASIQNIGNNSISRVFSNKFQIDVGADGTYDQELVTAGGTNTTFGLEYGKTCSTGSIVNTGSFQVYGSGSLTDSITDMCTELATSGQCCAAAISTTNTGGGGGGGGGGGFEANLVTVPYDGNVAAVYKSLAATVYDVDITVYSDPTKSTCTSGSCYAGTWAGQTGTQYDVPFTGWYGVTSPSWTNIPAGTHKVRMCADSPTSQLTEVNENNNCGPDLTFTVSGFDLVGGASGINSGQLIGGQQVTFFGTLSNSPASYVAAGQCSTTVVVTSGGACSIALNQDQIQWSTTGATIVSEVAPLTTSPTVPASGSGGIIEASPDGWYQNSAFLNSVSSYGISYNTSKGIHSGNSLTVDKICQLVYDPASWASAYDVTSFNSCGNNSIIKWTGSAWSEVGACSANQKIRYVFKCAKNGSPYAMSGTYTFPSPLGPGTHTYRLTSNAAAPNNTCQATIVVPNQTSGLCELTATPSIISAAQSSTLSWTLNGVSTLTCDQGLGTVTTNGGQSCSPAGEEIPAGGLCNESGTGTMEWGSCCSGTARWSCPAPNEPGEAYCWGNGSSGQANSVVVSPAATKTYTCTATTNPTIFNFSGCAPGEFQIDQGNNGSWDSSLSTSGCVTSLNVTQSTQMVSPAWTAVPGTHAVRFCANTPVSGGEGISTNNCGPSYVFSVSNPTQCQDGVDNNGNGLIDLADPACTSSGDASEETHAASTLILSANRTTVQKGSTVSLTWSATEVVADSCVISMTPGGSTALTGSSGTFTSTQLNNETVFRLTCTSMSTNQPVEVRTSVKLAPFFEEV